MQEIKRNKKQVSLREEFMREYLFFYEMIVGKLSAFYCACGKLACLAVEYAGGTSQRQDCQGCQQEKGVDGAGGGSGSHGVGGSL